MKIGIVLAWLGAPLVASHMRLEYPHPRGDPEDSATGPADYNLSSPMSAVTMCQGKPPSKVQATFRVKFAGTARHGGAAYTWPVVLPSNLPSCEHCTFAWTWVNAIGNREFYMNCADIKIVGGPGTNISGQGLFVANLPGFAQYQPPVVNGPPSESNTHNYPVKVI